MMKLKKGYKQTEIGVIPEDWVVKSLDKIGVFSKGKGIRKDEVQIDGIPCVRYGELYTHYDNTIEKFNSFINFESANQSKKIKYGDILFAGSGETKEDIGKSASLLSNLETYAGGDIIIFTPKETDPILLGYLLNTNTVKIQKSKIGQGDAVVHIYSSGLKNIQISLPSNLSEQKAIAQVLTDTDQLIQNLKTLIEKKKAIKQGAMQELLTGKKRLEGFVDKWVFKKLPELIWFQEGPGLRNWQFTDKGIKVINITNLVDGYLDLTKTTRHISLEEFGRMYKHFEIDSGDVVMASSGNSYCKTSIIRDVDLPLVMNTSVIRFKPKDNYDFKFMFIYLKSYLFKDQIDLLITGGAQPNFGPFHLNKVDLPFPKIAEQKAIAQILSDMDSEIEALEIQLQKTQNLKQGMMQELLTGKIRLVKSISQPNYKENENISFAAEPNMDY